MAFLREVLMALLVSMIGGLEIDVLILANRVMCHQFIIVEWRILFVGLLFVLLGWLKILLCSSLVLNLANCRLAIALWGQAVIRLRRTVILDYFLTILELLIFDLYWALRCLLVLVERSLLWAFALFLFRALTRMVMSGCVPSLLNWLFVILAGLSITFGLGLFTLLWCFRGRFWLFG